MKNLIVTIADGEGTVLDVLTLSDAAGEVGGDWPDTAWSRYAEAIAAFTSDVSGAVQREADRVNWRTYWTDANPAQDRDGVAEMKTFDEGWREVAVPQGEVTRQTEVWSQTVGTQWTSDPKDARVQSIKARAAARYAALRKERGW